METPLKNLVIVMVVLALAGTLAGTGYYLGALSPGQADVVPPKNSAEWGGLQIWSTPGNAYVEVDPVAGGMSYGAWTDEAGSAALSVEPFRTYRVTVTKESYRPYSTTIYVDSTSWAVVTANL